MPSCATASIIAFCSGSRGNSECCKSGHSAPSTDGPEQDAGDQLAHDRRLADPLHHLAEQPARKPAGR